MVWGSRFLEGAGYRCGGLRRIGQKIFAKLVSLITRYPVTDPTSGFRMTNRRGIELFARDYPHDFPEVEAILMVHAHDMSMREVPVTMRPRAHGSSSLAGYSAPYYMVRVMLAIFVGLFRRRPIPPPGDDWMAIAPSEALEASGADGRSLLAAGETLSTRVQIFAIAGSALLFFFVLELVRRRRLGEPYAILWLLARSSC